VWERAIKIRNQVKRSHHTGGRGGERLLGERREATILQLQRQLLLGERREATLLQLQRQLLLGERREATLLQLQRQLRPARAHDFAVLHDVNEVGLARPQAARQNPGYDRYPWPWSALGDAVRAPGCSLAGAGSA
jgi:hypothetical protein